MIDATDEFRETTLPKSLRPLTRLAPDWDDDGSDPPNDVALRAAAKVLECLSTDDVPKPDVSPSVEEGVCISFWHRDRYADIECFNTGEIVAAVMDEQRRHKTWTVRRTASDVLAAVSQLKKRLTESAI
ncbi:MAG TPA: hypothetical protein VNH11_16855 [Pirellulales bacterium]|nr:hypothetical protein [Pirellulales bacterium]